MTRDEAFEFLDRTARGIAEMFGSSCETLVHDMGAPGRPILSIYNGRVSGREAGPTTDGPGSDGQGTAADQVGLAAVGPDGRQIKSSTFHLTGEGYDLALEIGFDCTALAAADRILRDLMSVRPGPSPDPCPSGDPQQLEDLFDQCVAALGKPLDALTKADRLRAIALLREHSAFSYRRSVPYVAQRLGVSRYTVYKYLEEAGGDAPQ